MNKSRFTEDQIVRTLREADAEPFATVVKRHGVSEQTIYSWRKRYGALDVADERRRRELEAKNARRKKMLAERDLEIDVMKEVAKKKWLSCLTLVDAWTCECLPIGVAGSIRSDHVGDLRARLVSTHGTPRHLRSDNGPEFVARAILNWLSTSDIDTTLIDPGKPCQNATNESVNDKVPDEYLSLESFRGGSRRTF